MKEGSVILALDTETGGLTIQEDVLSIYACVLNEEFKMMDELDLKLKPDNRLPIAKADALRVNGIDIQKHLADAETITYSAAKEKLVAMIKKYLKKRGKYSNIRVMGYNVDFDLRFIQAHLIPENEWNQMIHYGKVDPKVITDFFKDCGIFPPECGSLISVVNHLGVVMGTAHTAKADTLATVEVYKKMIAIMQSKKDGGGQQVDLISLLESE